MDKYILQLLLLPLLLPDPSRPRRLSSHGHRLHHVLLHLPFLPLPLPLCLLLSPDGNDGGTTASVRQPRRARPLARRPYSPTRWVAAPGRGCERPLLGDATEPCRWLPAWLPPQRRFLPLLRVWSCATGNPRGRERPTATLPLAPLSLSPSVCPYGWNRCLLARFSPITERRGHAPHPGRTVTRMLMTKDRYGTHDGGKWLRSSNCLPLTNGRIQTCPGYSFTKQPNLQTLTTKLHVGALPLGHQAFDKLDDVNLMMLCWSMHPEYQGAPPLKKHPVQGTRDHFFMC